MQLSLVLQAISRGSRFARWLPATLASCVSGSIVGIVT